MTYPQADLTTALTNALFSVDFLQGATIQATIDVLSSLQIVYYVWVALYFLHIVLAVYFLGQVKADKSA